MFETFKFSLLSLKRNKTRTIKNILIIFFLVFSIVFTNASIFMSRSNKDLARELDYGSWIYAFNQENDPDRFEIIGTIHFLDDDFGSFDASMFKLSNFNIYRGRLPKTKDEIIMEISKLDDFELNYDLNQTVKLGDGNTYTLVGIITDYKGNWIEEINFPSVITTHKESNEFIYFGKTKSTVALPNGLIATNTLSYPQLDNDGIYMTDWTREDLLLTKQSLNVTYILLLVSSLILFVALFSNYEFYKKRIDILFGLGISRISRFIYYGVHIIFYTILIYPMSYFSHYLLKFGINLVPNFRYDNYLKHIDLVSKVLIFIIIIFSVLVMLKEFFEKTNIKFIKRFSYSLMLIIGVFTVIAINPKVIELKEEKFPNLKFQKEYRDTLYYYTLFDWPENEDYKPVTWSIGEIKSIENHEDTNIVYYFNHIDEKDLIIDGINGELEIVPENILKDLNIKYTNDFIEGDSFIVLNNSEASYNDSEMDLKINELKVNDLVLFNNQEFYLEDIISYDQTSDIALVVTKRMILSENAAHKSGLSFDTYNRVVIKANKLKSWQDYDAMIKKFSNGSLLNNPRFHIDKVYYQNYFETVFIIFEILVYLSLGIIINLILFSQFFLTKRRTFAIMYFLGKSRNLIIFRESIKLLGLSFISIFVSIIYLRFNNISISNLSVISLTMFTTSLIGFIGAYILGHVYLKENALEILEER